MHSASQANHMTLYEMLVHVIGIINMHLVIAGYQCGFLQMMHLVGKIVTLGPVLYYVKSYMRSYSSM